MPAKKKPAAKKKPEYLTLDEAAEYVGMTPHELQLTRYRGIEPGTLASKVDGQIVWEKAVLTPAPDSEDDD